MSTKQRIANLEARVLQLDDMFRRHFHAGTGDESLTPIVPIPFADAQPQFHTRRTTYDNHAVRETAKVLREAWEGSTRAGLRDMNQLWEGLAAITLDVAVSLVELQLDEQQADEQTL